MEASASTEAGSEPTLGTNRPVIPAANVTVRRSAAVSRSGPIPVARTAVICRSVVAGAPVSVIPRARANEQATHKVARSPITVRRASVRVVGEVAVSADRLRTDVHGTYAHPDSDLGRPNAPGGGKKQDPEQSCVF